MKRLSLLLAAALFAAASGCIYALTYKPLPETQGDTVVPGLQAEVTVIRDRNGVPHIFAQNEDDSYIALGYVHAQDRLWQMEMMRHLSEGRLSELVGNMKVENPLFAPKTTLDLDYYNRVIGFGYLAEKGTERLDARSRQILELYASGINRYVQQNKKRLPAEFVLLGHEFEPWTPKDTAALYLYIAWGLNNDWYSELLRYAIARERGGEKAWEILPLHDDPGPFIFEESPRPEAGGPAARQGAPSYRVGPASAVAELLDTEALIRSLGLSLGFPAASNNWVVSGARTATGKPLLCNDPHLPLTVPSIWYEIHIRRPGMDVMGVMFPGTPAIAIGRNRDIAWGNTTPFEDSMDLFVERVNPANPNEYLRDGVSVPFETRTERIFYKKGTKMRCLDRQVRMSVHGPILNDVVPALRNAPELLAVRWTAYDLDFRSKGLNMLALGEARNWEEFRQSIDIGIPIFNWVYADTKGNIGYTAPGLIPIRGKGDGTYPVPGWDSQYDWRGYVPLENMPRMFNPQRGFIVTANNQLFPEGTYPFIFSRRYMPSYRAARIRELLLEKKALTVEDMKRIQADVTTKQGERLARHFIDAYERSGDKRDPVVRDAVDLLRRWDYRCGVDSSAASVFHTAYSCAFKNILGDEMSEGVFRAFRDDIAIETSFDNLLEKDSSELFDDRSTERKETKDEILFKSLEEAVRLLVRHCGSRPQKWAWGKIHTLEMEHITFGRVPVLEWIFNVGPYAFPGSRHTVNNGFYAFGDSTLPFAVFVGSSFREIIDLSNEEHMYAVITTGQSGHYLSRHYKDQTRKWLELRYTSLSMNDADLRTQAEGRLVLRPEEHR